MVDEEYYVVHVRRLRRTRRFSSVRFQFATFRDGQLCWTPTEKYATKFRLPEAERIRKSLTSDICLLVV